MSKEKPDHHDAQLILELYELRREAVMRQSRTAINGWIPRSFEDVQAIAQPTHPLNAAWRQVASYWEMTYSMARHGIVHGEFMAENCAEGLLLFAKIEPHLERFRRDMSPTAFTNAEWIAKETAMGRQRLALFKKRVEAQAKAQA